jgi:hypothetical protein
MIKFQVYGKAACAKCESTKDKVRHLVRKSELDDKVGIAFVDMDSIEGMAEGAFHDVLDIPTTIVWSEKGEALARWDGCIPPSAEIKSFLAQTRA